MLMKSVLSTLLSCFALLSAFPVAVQAQAANHSLSSWDVLQQEWQRVQKQGQQHIELNIENDSLLMKKEDGLYTSGLHFIAKKQLLEKHSTLSYSWQLRQDLYTASDIKLKPNQISKYDHPYAGLLSFGLFRAQQEADGRGATYGLELGCLGPCAGGEWTQTHLHRLLKQPLPQAWSTELPQEWGVIASAKWQSARFSMFSNLDLQPSLTTRFGNLFTDAQIDVVLRAGQLNALPEQAAHYTYARAALRASAHNATLQGGYFNRQEFPFHAQTWVPEVELGYLYRQAHWGVSAAIVRRASEIKEWPSRLGAQNFAKVRLVYMP